MQLGTIAGHLILKTEALLGAFPPALFVHCLDHTTNAKTDEVNR